MRISEVTKLTPEKVNLEGKSIFIELGKGSKDRIVPLPKGFQERHLKEQTVIWQ